MLTDINAKILAQRYGMAASNYCAYLRPHKEELTRLATKRYDITKGREVKRREYNSEQLKYIIEKIFVGTPLGWDFDGNTLVKTTDFV